MYKGYIGDTEGISWETGKENGNNLGFRIFSCCRGFFRGAHALGVRSTADVKGRLWPFLS